jgi:hypothetical protein
VCRYKKIELKYLFPVQQKIASLFHAIDQKYPNQTQETLLEQYRTGDAAYILEQILFKDNEGQEFRRGRRKS